MTAPIVWSDPERIRAVLAWATSRRRQNAHTRAWRTDAEAALQGAESCVEFTLQRWHRLFAGVDAMLVVRVDPSPMNPKRKLLQLACGHETWSGRRSKTARCDRCAADRDALYATGKPGR